MTARLLCACLLTAVLAVSVQCKPRGKYEYLLNQPSKAEDAGSPASSDGDSPILPTSFPLEASSPDPGDEDTSELLGRGDTGVLQVSVVGEGNTVAPVLLSEEELYVPRGSEEEQQVIGEDEEDDEEKDEMEEAKEDIAEDGGGEAQQDEAVEVGSSTEMEIPVDLDYTDSDATDPSITKLREILAWPSKAEDDGIEGELPTAMEDYDSQQSPQEAKSSTEGSGETGQGVAVEVCEDERLWDNEKHKPSHRATSERGWRKRKAQRLRKVRKNSQSDPPSLSAAASGRARGREPETEPDSKLHTAHKARRRSEGPLVGLDPVQIRTTVDPFPWTRPTAGPRPGGQDAPAMWGFVLDPDPCENFPCEQGRTCELSEGLEPRCVCQDPAHCPSTHLTQLEHVCGTDNQTYLTPCQLFATKCRLEDTRKGHRLHLDYVGPCKLIPPCLNTELHQFPLRMREWLKNVLLQMYEHDSVTSDLLTAEQRARVRKLQDSQRLLHMGDPPIELLAQDFEKNYDLYIYPVHWQFTQLDKHPTDRVLTHSELAPLRAPLLPMEHCTSVFLRACDGDGDGLLSLREWGQCFGLKREDMDAQLLF
ncbi:SPARC-like protein 1 isoform X2 [Brachyhypopomus gauderio]|uniref:SPARC-like protein 1 isoform X2 n=1 Tax=Brachyhypopomus gauderio TaxID=698409 RepID=UPI004042A50E